MLSVAEAQARIVAALRPLPVESVGLDEALGRVLAETIVSQRLLPAFDNSGMDGYAVRAGEVAGATDATPVVLPVSGESRAGGSPDVALPPGTAMLVMTGAPVPRGADAVVRYEDTDRGRDQVAVRVAVAPGTSLRHAGEDMSPGDEVLAAGRRLRSADLAACAALGVAELPVRRRPRVAVLSTGDELVEAGDVPGPGQLADSNGPALAAAIVEAGGVAVRMGIARDTAADVRDRLLGSEGCDLIVCSAGVSVGDHDHVRDVVEELGSLDFWRVAMRPGKPLAVGEVRGVPFIGLPGNPVSSQVTFELFARPALLALQGAAEIHRRRWPARVLEDMAKPDGLETFARGILVAGDDVGVPGVRLTGSQSSGVMRSLVLADCLVVLPASGSSVRAGSLVEVIPLAQ
jgi:molybdopterin molybdotransferase